MSLRDRRRPELQAPRTDADITDMTAGSEAQVPGGSATWGSGLDATGVSVEDARVIIVDDLEANVRLLEGLLRSAGIHNIYGFTDPEVFAASCGDLEPDLVLLDLHMPRMDGFEVLAALQAATPDDTFIPVLVLTADATPETRAARCRRARSTS